MKVLKITGIVLGLLILVIVVLGLVAPTTYHVERTVMIDAPKELVFGQVKYWRNWTKWSPWGERDEEMEVTVEGRDGEVGSTYNWVGDPEITGSGTMTNTGLNEPEEITYHLHFLEPWESESDGYMRLSAEGEGTRAAWGFQGENSFPLNVVMLFMSMEDMMAPDFDRGLELLKQISEEMAEAVKKYEVKEADFPSRQYTAVRGNVDFASMKAFFGSSFAKIQTAMTQKRARMTGAPAGLYFSWDEQNQTSDLAAGIPSNKVVNKDDVTTLKIDAGKVLLVDYFGNYEKIVDAHNAINLYLKQNKLSMKFPVIEEYVTDPMSEPDTSKWLTKVYYLIQ